MNLQITKKGLSSVFLFLMILFASGFLLLTDSKRAGIPYLREALTFVIMTYVLLRLTINKWYLKTPQENFILIYATSFILLSIINAYLFHDQPLLYGILEERRVFQYFLFFIVLWALVKHTVTIDDIVKFLIISFVITSIWGYLYYFSIIPDNASPDYAKDFSDGTDSLDIRTATRYMVGTTWLTIIFTYATLELRQIYRQTGKISFKYSALILYIILFLWLVIQTRSTMLVIAFIFVVVLRSYLLVLFLKYGLFLTLFLGLFFLASSEWVYEQIDKLTFLVDEATDNTGPRVREITASIILDEISKSYYWGQGALSLQWHDGFRQLYNQNFYLSDVGIFGIYYRFGLLAPIFIIGFYLFIFINLFKYKNEHLLIKAYYITFLISLLSLVFSPEMAFGGFKYGLILGITAYLHIKYRESKA